MTSTVYGIHAVMAFLTHHPQAVKQCYLLNKQPATQFKPIIELCQQHQIHYHWLTPENFHQQLANCVHQGVFLEIQPLPPMNETDLLHSIAHKPQPLLLLLDNIQDPHNLGACLRTACAAGVDAVIVPKDKAVGLTPAVRKVSCGAAEILPFCSVTNLAQIMKQLQAQGIWLVGLASEAKQSMYEIDFKGAIGIVMGSEHEGLRRLTRKHCDFLASIPMLGSLNSLNVSVATGIVLYEALRQRGY